MRLLLCCIALALISGTSYSQQPAPPPSPRSIEACAVALTPLNDLITLTDHQKYAWLNLITEETYQSAKTAIKASADVDLLDLIKLGSAEADYNTFSENRRKYLEKHQGEYERMLAVSIYTQHLPADAHEKWLECVKAVSRQPGLTAWFEQEKETTARLVIHYFGVPGGKIDASLTAMGVTRKPPQKVTLAHDASEGILLERREGSSIVINVTGGGFTTGAASAYPVSTGSQLSVSPYIASPQSAIRCPADGNCSFCVRGLTFLVDVPKGIPPGPELLLTAESGGAVSPGAGPFKFGIDRALDDIKLTAPASYRFAQEVLSVPLASWRPVTKAVRNLR